MNAADNWIRALPQRFGKTTLIALALIAVVGLGARAYVVVKPVEHPADDSHAYYALAKALYEEGSFGGPEFRDSSDWSPGAPLLYAASFYATGGAREGTARIVEALLGVAAILVVFLLGHRLGEAAGSRVGPRLGSAVGLLAATAVAVYPPFIHSTGELMSEPPAILTLPAAVLAFLWAGERERSPGAWLLPGLLFGLTAMFRPEYLFVGAAFVVLATLCPVLARGWSSGWKPGLAGAALFLVALLLPILPWTIRNVDVLGRVVPISTGSGKALYVGTYLPADGEYQRVKALLYERYEHKSLPPNSEALNNVNPTPLFNRVAERYPDLPRDSALGKIGKENLSKYCGEDPVGYLAMTGAQGRAHVEQRGRRSDEQRGRAGGPDPARGARAGRVHRARVAPALVGSGRAGDADRARHRDRRRLAGRPAAQRGADDAGLPTCRPGAVTGGRGHILRSRMVPRAGIFPAELTALRSGGLIFAIGLIAYAIVRRRSLRNVDVLLLLAAGLGLALVSGTEIVDGLLSAFSFEKGNGGRILGLAVFAIFILFFLILRALSVAARNSRQLSAALEGLAWEEFRQAGLPERFRGKIAILVPAYNEAENIGHVLDQMPAAVCGVGTEVLVVDDGSRDGTGDVAAAHGAAVARHVTNRGGGAALRTGYRLMVESGAEIVVTLDADGQHLPSEMERLVKPVLDGEVDMAHGSRVLGHADRNHFARELGIVFFNRLVSFITRTHVTDCSNGYRAVRTTVLPQLVLRQEQFHTSEFMIEAIKRGIPAKEVPITVEQRLHGHSKKPAVFRYGVGFANAIVRTWLR